MNLGIMQPYFFPYIGYFDLINRTDRWIVFDVVKYAPKRWMNRNRVFAADGTWQWITVPVDRSVGLGLIKDVVVTDKEQALRRILGQLAHYRAVRAPFYSAVRAVIEDVFAQSNDTLVDLNVRGLAAVCDYIGVDFSPIVLSKSGIVLPPITKPGDWALEISSALGASEYTNPPGGAGLFDADAFSRRGIEIGFTQLPDFHYACDGYPFIEHLSILDGMMWNAPAVLHAFLKKRSSVSVTRVK